MVYFIEEMRTGLIKIGYSFSMAWRLGEHQRIYGKQLRVLGVREGGNYEESRIQNRFFHCSLGAEWHWPNKELTDYIKQHTVAWDGYSKELADEKPDAHKFKADKKVKLTIELRQREIDEIWELARHLNSRKPSLPKAIRFALQTVEKTVRFQGRKRLDAPNQMRLFD